MTAVHNGADRVGERHRRGTDKVLLANLRRIATGLACRRVDETFHNIGELAETGATGNAGRHGIGIDRADIHVIAGMR